MNLIISILLKSFFIVNFIHAQQFQQQSGGGSSFQQQSGGGSSFQQQSSNGGSQQQYSNGTHLITVKQDLKYSILRLVGQAEIFQPNLNAVVSFGNGTHVLKIYGDGRTPTIELIKQEAFTFAPFSFAPFPTFAPFSFAPFNFGK